MTKIEMYVASERTRKLAKSPKLDKLGDILYNDAAHLDGDASKRICKLLGVERISYRDALVRYHKAVLHNADMRQSTLGLEYPVWVDRFSKFLEAETVIEDIFGFYTALKEFKEFKERSLMEG